MERELYTINKAATVLAVSSRTIRRMLDRHELQFVRIGRAVRIPVSDLNRWMDENTIRADNQDAGRGVQENRTCHTNAKIVQFGGRVSPIKTAKELDNLLGPRTGKKPKR